MSVCAALCCGKSFFLPIPAERRVDGGRTSATKCMMYIRNWITILGYLRHAESEWLAAFAFLNYSSRRQGDMKWGTLVLSFVGDVCVVAPLLLPWMEPPRSRSGGLRLAGEISTYLIMIIPKNKHDSQILTSLNVSFRCCWALDLCHMSTAQGYQPDACSKTT